jgi:hypothetical protein
MSIREASPQGHYAVLPAGGDHRAPWPCQQTGPSDPPKPRLLDRVHATMFIAGLVALLAFAALMVPLAEIT